MRLLLARAVRLALRIFFLFPMRDKRIFFIVHGGRFYNCNPKYIYRCLGEHHPGEFEAVWCLRDERLLTDRYPGTKIVKPRSLRYFVMALTSKVIISNTGFSSMLPKRRGQIYMNTWHGGGSYKKCGLDVRKSGENRQVEIDAGRRTDIFLSCSSDFSKNMSGARKVAPDRFAATGTPRIDIFFGDGCREASDRLRKELGLAGCKAALYAPTFRGREKKAISRLTLDVELLRTELCGRFGGDWKILIRRHPFGAVGQLNGCIDVSGCPDMQELLCMADVLITDYSSCLWDYSFTYRPCFVLADDVDSYEEERGFYLPIREWPYPAARDNRELSQCIRNFDADAYKKKVRVHHEKLGSYETGKAAEEVCRLLHGLCMCGKAPSQLIREMSEGER